MKWSEIYDEIKRLRENVDILQKEVESLRCAYEFSKSWDKGLKRLDSVLAVKQDEREEIKKLAQLKMKKENEEYKKRLQERAKRFW